MQSESFFKDTNYNDLWIEYGVKLVNILLFLCLELQRTMCLLVYESGLLPSSYISLNDEVLWNDCLDTFLRDASLILNYPSTR